MKVKIKLEGITNFNGGWVCLIYVIKKIVQVTLCLEKLRFNVIEMSHL